GAGAVHGNVAARPQVRRRPAAPCADRCLRGRRRRRAGQPLSPPDVLAAAVVTAGRPRLPNHAPESPAVSPLPEIDGYRLLRVLGHGGMSTVYLAEQVSLGREVAVKVMLPEALADEVSRRRFENEARTVARLEHPNIVGIFEVGRTRDGLPYYAMPHLPRGHLGQL